MAKGQNGAARVAVERAVAGVEQLVARQKVAVEVRLCSEATVSFRGPYNDAVQRMSVIGGFSASVGDGL